MTLALLFSQLILRDEPCRSGYCVKDEIARWFSGDAMQQVNTSQV
jgi:hypothetical protein